MAFNIRGKLSLDGSGFQSGVTRAKSQAKSLRNSVGASFKGMVAGMGAMMAIAAIGQQIKKTLEWATRIRDLGVQFGVSTAFVQKMDYAMKQTGLDVEKAFKGFRKMSLAVAEARGGVEGMTQTTADMKLGAFKVLGITLQQIKTMRPQDLFMQIAKNVQNMNKSAAELHSAMNTVFGKVGSELLNTFANDLEGMFQKMEELGLVEDRNIQRIGALGDQLEAMKTKNRGIWADILSGFRGAFMAGVDMISAGVQIFEERVTLILTAIDKGMTAAKAGFAMMKGGFSKKDRDAFKEAMDEARNAQQAAHRGARGQTNFLSELGLVADARRREREDLANEIKLMQSKVQKATEASKAIEDAQKKINALKDEENKRSVEGMTSAQRTLHFSLQRLAAAEEMKRLGKELSQEEMDAIIAKEKLTGDAEIHRRKDMVTNNLAIMEARKSEHAFGKKLEKEQEEKTKAKAAAIGAKASGMAGWAGDAKFAQLARIGGALGGRNPVLDIAKKQFYTITELRDIAARQAASLSQISGTP